VILALSLYFESGVLPDPSRCARAEPPTEPTSTARTASSSCSPPGQRVRQPRLSSVDASNFASLAADRRHVARKNASKLDQETWDEFHLDRSRLARLASALRHVFEQHDSALAGQEDGEDQGVEDRILFRYHRIRERDRRLVKRKAAW
jgi:hypothetical protein